MKNNRHNKAFTLVEVMLAAAILVIGLMLVAGAFPVGIKLTAISTERVIGSLVSQEASSKIYLYGDPNDQGQTPPFGIEFDVPAVFPSDTIVNFETVLRQPFDPAEFWYPSTDVLQDKLYHWSALVKRDFPLDTDIDAVIFVSRISNVGAKYPNPYNLNNPLDTITVPKPIAVPVVFPDTADDNKIVIVNDNMTGFDERILALQIPDGAVLVMLDADSIANDVMILNVLDVNRDPSDTSQWGYGTITLTKPADSKKINTNFWVIPSATGSSRNPCIAVYPHTFIF